MKVTKPVLAAAALLGALVCAGAQARPGGHHDGRGHGHTRVGVGVSIGGPLFWPGPWYGEPFYDPFYGPFYRRYYDYAPVYVVPAPPPVYIERGMPPPAPPAQFWYYCNDPQGYYPYVKECRTPWRAVSPEEVQPKREGER